jgi:hypothetical protein
MSTQSDPFPRGPSEAPRYATIVSEIAHPANVTAPCRQSVTKAGGFSPCPLNFPLNSLHQPPTPAH